MFDQHSLAQLIRLIGRSFMGCATLARATLAGVGHVTLARGRGSSTRRLSSA